MFERDLQIAIRLALGKRNDCVFWKNSTGMVEHASGHKQRYGLCVGSSDLIGIVKMPGDYPGTDDDVFGVDLGRFCALEIKQPGKYPTADQKTFLALVRKMGGFGAVVRSPEEAIAAVERCKRGMSE